MIKNINRIYDIEISFEKRRSFLVAVSSLLLLASLLFFRNLWVADRQFPVVPAFAWLTETPTVVHTILYYLSIGASVAGAVFYARWPRAAALSLILLIGLSCSLDMLRLQPPIYMVIIALILALIDKSTVSLQMVFVLVYFWAGFQKLNYKFIFIGFKKLTADIFPVISPGWLAAMAVLFAVFEMAVGFSLFFRKTRNLGLLLVTALHLGILLLLSPFFLDWEPFVWAWNLWMILMAWIVFYNSENLWPPNFLNPAVIIVLLLCVAGPVVNLFGWWNDGLSFKFYSLNARGSAIKVYEGSLWHESPLLQKAIVREEIINIAEWGFTETGAPEFSNEWYYKRFFKKVCSDLKVPATDRSISLFITDIPDRLTGAIHRQEYFCSDLNQTL